MNLPLINRVFPSLFASQTVGVQPLSGAGGLAYAMRFVHPDPYDTFQNVYLALSIEKHIDRNKIINPRQIWGGTMIK